MARCGTTKGGAFRGKERSDRHDATHQCPICGKMNTKRKSMDIRGGRFCKSHGGEYAIITIMHYSKKKSKAA